MTSHKAKRPIALTAIGVFFVTAGLIFTATGVAHKVRAAAPWAEVGPALSMAAAAAFLGIFLLRGRNWARWSMVAFMGLNAVMSLLVRRPVIAVLLSLTVAGYLVLSEEVESFFGGRSSGKEDEAAPGQGPDDGS